MLIHKISVVKPENIFMARSRVPKSCLMAELCLQCYVHFGCVPIFIFSFHHKQCASVDFSVHLYLYIHIHMICIILVVWLTNKRCFALFSAETIVRDPHRCRILDMLEAGFELAQNLSSGLVEWRMKLYSSGNNW